VHGRADFCGNDGFTLSEAATGELAALRAEARHQADEAEAVRDQVAAELEVVRQTAAAAQVELEATRAQLAEI
jgi:hypothetical protein